jgi:hypothetical protein
MPFSVMIAWQNFSRDGALRVWVLQQHDGFSVDREGNDVAAFRQAADVLRSKSNPLVIFPEGDIYHVNDRILPFHGRIIRRLSRTRPGEEHIADLFFVIQLFSYPGDYVAEDPNIERIAEAIDTLEEDVLEVKTANNRGSRMATVTLGEPLPVPSGCRGRLSATELTRLLETRVQGLLSSRSPS